VVHGPRSRSARLDPVVTVVTQRVDAVRAQRLLRQHTTFVDVLPAAVFQQEHLPGAVSLPLETFEASQVEGFERDKALLVYCFDQH